MAHSIKEKLQNHMHTTGLSIQKVADSMGVSRPKLSSYLNDKTQERNMSVKEIEKQVSDWLARDEQRRASLAIPIVETKTTRNIDTICSTTHANNAISVVYGAAGTGKSTALARYAKENTGVYLIEVDQSFSLTVLASEICRVIGINPTGTNAILTKRIQEKLQNMDALLIFDECDYLSTRTLEWIRRVIHDKSQCGVILAGLQRLEFELKNQKNAHDQLVSRVLYWACLLYTSDAADD